MSADKFRPGFGNQADPGSFDLQSLLGGLNIGGKSQVGGGSVMNESMRDMRGGMDMGMRQYNDQMTNYSQQVAGGFMNDRQSMGENTSTYQNYVGDMMGGNFDNRSVADSDNRFRAGFSDIDPY